MICDGCGHLPTYCTCGPRNLALNEHGRWVPAEPLEGTFGLRWEFAWRHRRSLGQGWVRSVLGGFRDTRAVDRMAS